MSRNGFETMVGFLVITIAVGFLYYALGAAQIGGSKTSAYAVNVNFDRMDGLNVGGDVKISGLKVGTVASAEIDPDTYQARVKMNINNSVKLPDDSAAEIISAGLLGDKYIAIVPGGSEDYLKDNGRIKFSQSSVSLEALIGKFMFGSSDEEKKEEKESTF